VLCPSNINSFGVFGPHNLDNPVNELSRKRQKAIYASLAANNDCQPDGGNHQQGRKRASHQNSQVVGIAANRQHQQAEYQ